MTIPAHSSPNLPHISAIVIGWLTEPHHRPLASLVAGWDAADWEAARWAVQVHGIGPLLDRAAECWPDADALHANLRSYLSEQRRLSGERVALLRDATRREQLARGAQAWARAHDADWTAARFEAIYDLVKRKT